MMEDTDADLGTDADAALPADVALPPTLAVPVIAAPPPEQLELTVGPPPPEENAPADNDWSGVDLEDLDPENSRPSSLGSPSGLASPDDDDEFGDEEANLFRADTNIDFDLSAAAGRAMPNLKVPFSARDPLMPKVFISHLAMLSVLGIFSWLSTKDKDAWLPPAAIGACSNVIFLCVCLSALLTVLWVIFFVAVAANPHAPFLRISHGLSAAGLVSFAFFMLLQTAHTTLAVLALMLVVSDALWAARAKSQEQATVSMLGLVLEVLGENKSVFFILLAVGGAQSFFFLVWGHSLLHILAYTTGGLHHLILLSFVTFSFYWTTQFLRHVMNVVVSGCVYMW
jgi:hypothetical protein